MGRLPLPLRLEVGDEKARARSTVVTGVGAGKCIVCLENVLCFFIDYTLLLQSPAADHCGKSAERRCMRHYFAARTGVKQDRLDNEDERQAVNEFTL
jgi:hypothetical protein